MGVRSGHLSAKGGVRSGRLESLSRIFMCGRRAGSRPLPVTHLFPGIAVSRPREKSGLVRPALPPSASTSGWSDSPSESLLRREARRLAGTRLGDLARFWRCIAFRALYKDLTCSRRAAAGRLLLGGRKKGLIWVSHSPFLCVNCIGIPTRQGEHGCARRPEKKCRTFETPNPRFP